LKKEEEYLEPYITKEDEEEKEGVDEVKKKAE
jgi:hypothetical protein